MCRSNDYVLSDYACEKIRCSLAEKVAHKENHFANGRMVRNIFDNLIMNHARRVVSLTNPSREELSTIISDDYTVQKEA